MISPSQIEKRKNGISSSILITVSVIFLAFLIFPFSLIIITTLMGNGSKFLVCTLLIFTFIVILNIFFANYKLKFIFITIVSLVYAGLIGIINFRFLPTMKELAKSYGTTEHTTIFPGTREFDPSSIDYVFYERIFTAFFILLILIAIISTSFFIYRTMKEKKTTFRIINNNNL